MKMCGRAGIGKTMFEAKFRSQFNDSKLFTTKKAWFEVTSHNAFDQSEGLGKGTQKKKWR